MSQEAMERIKQIETIRDKIHSQYPDFDWPEPILEPIYFGRLNKEMVKDRKLIMDVNTGIQWDVVSDRYELIPHELVLFNLLKACPKEYGTPKIKLRSWSQGACFRAETLFPKAKLDAEIQVGDVVRPRVVSYSSYNRSTFYGIEVGAEQLVCGNGQVSFVTDTVSKRKHILTVNEPTVIENTITAFLENFSKETKLWKEWANRKLSVLEMEEVTTALPFSDNEREKMLELPLLSKEGAFLKELGTDATLWDVNSAATQMAAHEIKSKRRAVELEANISRVIRNLGA